MTKEELNRLSDMQDEAIKCLTKTCAQRREQLTKAKEIIANILTYFPDYKVKTFDDMSLLNALDKAEQFLKEVENA